MAAPLSSLLFKQASRVFPGGVHSPVRSFRSLDADPIFFKRAKGPFLWSVEGRKYLDFCQSFGPLVLGHRHSAVQARVGKMINNAWSLGACEPYSLELGEEILNVVRHKIPDAQLRFVSSGTEAVMTALRLARAYTNKSKIIKFDGCYHGHHDSMLIQAGSGLAGQSVPSSSGVPLSVADDVLICELGNEEKLNQIIQEHKNEIAAIIIEPLPANYGLMPHLLEFLQALIALAKKNQILLILDEVITGFRVAAGGMMDLWNLEADIICYGKVIGGGFPLAAFVGKFEIMQQLAPVGKVYQAGTLSAHPPSVIAGLATLAICLRDSDFYVNLEKECREFCQKFEETLNEISNFKWKVVQFSSLFWAQAIEDTYQDSGDISKPKDFSMQADEIARQKEAFNEIFPLCLEAGIYLSPSPFEICFFSTAHKRKVYSKYLKRLRKTKKS